ncbi:MAG: Eco57I restriction-modification methylase domain-containing protein [Candidatus Hermodarchaeota archaeon]
MMKWTVNAFLEILKSKGFAKIKKCDEYIQVTIDECGNCLLIFEIETFPPSIRKFRRFLGGKRFFGCIICPNESSYLFFRATGRFVYFNSQTTSHLKRKIDLLRWNDISSFFTIFEHPEVTDVFYKTYTKLHSNLAKEFSVLGEENADLYALTIMNRLIFLFFIQKKEFLQRKEQDYLESAWSYIEDLKKNYFYDFLLPLWFRFLSAPEEDSARYQTPEERFLFGTVPFIHGNLFKSINKEWLKESAWGTNPVFSISNMVFKELLTFLNSFEWILRFEEETISIGNRVIDPEILGYIFERSVNRTDLGGFYTPNYVTRMMARDAIEGYILAMATKLCRKEWNSINELVISGTPEQLVTVQKVLEDIKILDGSCGAGAFLVAAAEILLSLHHLFGISSTDFEIAKKIIENNIYGVDILEGAIQTCHLRLWLFLAGFMSSDKILPLPDLDTRLVTGNFLLGLGFERHKLNDKKKGNLDAVFIQKIMDLVRHKRSRTIKFTSEDVMQEKILHWELHFPECLARGGFDIIIGNPPWGSRARGAKLTHKIKTVLKMLYPAWGNNLYGAFWCKTLELLHSNGWACYITPDTFTSIKTFEKLRKRLLDTTIHKMVLFGDGLFRDAQIMGTLSLLIENQVWKENHEILVVDGREVSSKFILAENPPSIICYKVEQRVWQNIRRKRFLHGITPKILQLFVRGSKTALLSPTFGKGRQGIATANNKRFLRNIDEVAPQEIGYKREDFITGSKKWAKFSMGRWITPYQLNFRKVILWENNGKELRTQALCKERRAYLRNEEYYFTPFEKGEGITYKGLGIENLCATRLPRNCIFGHGSKTFFVLPEMKKYFNFILAFLNSSVAQFFKSRCINTGKNTEVADIEEMPIILPNDSQLKKINELVFQAERNSTSEIMVQIDKLVMEIYGFTSEDLNMSNHQLRSANKGI